MDTTQHTSHPRAVARRAPRLRAVAVAALGLALATSGAAVAAPAPAAVARDQQPHRLVLPAPSGRHPIGTTSLHLVDPSRRDPWLGRRSTRELMVSVWYPATAAVAGRRAPWLPRRSAARYQRLISQELGAPLDGIALPRSHATLRAPAAHGSHPVVLFSPGYGSERQLGSALVEDLASRGYVVVSIDHTYEAPFVEFPGGRMALTRQPAEPTRRIYRKALAVRVADTELVLDGLTRLDAGRNPDAEHRRLPRGLAGTLDLSRIGMFGHSMGGDTAAEVMAQDRRVRAGVDLDGSITGPVAATGLDRPFLLMANATHDRAHDPSWQRLWSHLRGWRRMLQLSDSAHLTFTDLPVIVRQIERAVPLPPDVVAELEAALGALPARRAVAVQRAYLAAFFDRHLRHRGGHLLAGPSPRFPEISFVP